MTTSEKFPVGTRVRVYETRLNGQPSAYKGIVIEQNSHGMICVRLDNMGSSCYHPKQCRRLVKKERRRVLVLTSELQAAQLNTVIKCYLRSRDALQNHSPNYIEFVEVRRKK